LWPVDFTRAEEGQVNSHWTDRHYATMSATLHFSLKKLLTTCFVLIIHSHSASRISFPLSFILLTSTSVAMFGVDDWKND
jgi:hypothetical protein